MLCKRLVQREKRIDALAQRVTLGLVLSLEPLHRRANGASHGCKVVLAGNRLNWFATRQTLGETAQSLDACTDFDRKPAHETTRNKRQCHERILQVMKPVEMRAAELPTVIPTL